MPYYCLFYIWMRIQSDPDPKQSKKDMFKCCCSLIVTGDDNCEFAYNHLLGRNLASQLLKMKLVSSEEALEFCSCNDEKEQFRQDRADVFFIRVKHSSYD